MRLAIVTNIPAPYRVPVYNLLARMSGIVLHVFYSKDREPDREWDLPEFEHSHTYLKGRMYQRGEKFIHSNPEVWLRLSDFSPDVLITTGYNPTHLYAIAYAWTHGIEHVPMTDGTDISEAGLTRLHRIIRAIVIRKSRAFIAASSGGRRLFWQYGVKDQRIHFSPLCANESVPWPVIDGTANRHFDIDLLFSGRLVERKNAFFFLRVAQMVAKRLGRKTRVALLGSGPLEVELRDYASSIAEDVDATFAGHVSQGVIPDWFRRSGIFLFPSKWDPWGIVANEACRAGLPVIVSDHAGVAHELVVHGKNGYVLPLDEAEWTEAAVKLISNRALYRDMSAESLLHVKRYSFENAAKGIADAAHMVTGTHVVCVQRRLTHYRVQFFERLREALKADGIYFDLVHGQPNKMEKLKRDSGQIDWADFARCYYAFGGRICWQNPSSVIRRSNLTIVPHENKMLFNVWGRLTGALRYMAFWGHGRNFQSSYSTGWRERYKIWTGRHCDWWFAYTTLSAKAVQATGFPLERISVLENSIDTTELIRLCELVTNPDIEGFRCKHRLGNGPTAIFLGSLYREKRVAFLLDAAARIAAKTSGFVLIVAGDGPDRKLVEEYLPNAAWLRYVGTIQGEEKAVALRTASVMLNPGLVGLGILDSFAAGLPLITTDCGLHSPEIDYLKNDENGLMTENTPESFVSAVMTVLADTAYHARLSAGARRDAERYSIDNMVDNFRSGVLLALDYLSKNAVRE